MLTVSMKTTDTKQLASVVRDLAELTKEMWVPVHQTAHWARRQALKSMGKTINTPIKNLDPVFYYKKNKPYSVTVSINRAKAQNGIPLKFFNPRQLKRGKGVSVNSYFKGAGKQVNPKWFMFANGKNVYERFGKGRRDYRMVRYPETVATYRQRGLESVDKAAIQARLTYYAKRRMRYLILRAQGKLRGKQPKAV